MPTTEHIAFAAHEMPVGFKVLPIAGFNPVVGSELSVQELLANVATKLSDGDELEPDPVATHVVEVPHEISIFPNL